MDKYRIQLGFSPSSADIHHILEVKKLGLSHITIRQARWIARLWSHIRDSNELWRAAYGYSLKEAVCNISKTPIDTSELDEYIARKGKLDPNLVFKGVDIETQSEAYAQITKWGYKKK